MHTWMTECPYNRVFAGASEKRPRKFLAAPPAHPRPPKPSAGASRHRCTGTLGSSSDTSLCHPNSSQSSLNHPSVHNRLRKGSKTERTSFFRFPQVFVLFERKHVCTARCTQLYFQNIHLWAPDACTGRCTHLFVQHKSLLILNKDVRFVLDLFMSPACP